MKMPNLQGVGPALAKLQHAIEADASKFLTDVETAHARKDASFAKAQGKLTEARAALTEVDKFIDDLDKATNGNPTSDDSSESSAAADTQHKSL